MILWKQTHFLVTSKGLPPELEFLVKDLWTLRLQNLAYRVDDEVDGDNDTQSQMFSSQSEGETDTDGERSIRKSLKKDSTPKLRETLALCYLGMVLLRLPYTPGDISRWASKGELLYHRSIVQLPKEMREQLPGAYQEALDPRPLLKAGHVRESVGQLVILFKRDFGMSFPPLNRPLLTFRYINTLSLPLDVYMGMTRLMEKLDFALEYPKDISKRLDVIALPEAQLAAMVIIATKLLYPFDEFYRYPTTPAEPAATLFSWEIWSQTLSNSAEASQSAAAAPAKLSFEQAMKIEDKDVFAMSEKELDNYLDFYEQTWMEGDPKGQGKERDFQEALFRMFPTNKAKSLVNPSTSSSGQEGEAIDPKSESAKIVEIISAMQPQRAVTEEQAEKVEEPVLRPGNRYQRHRDMSTVLGFEKLFYEEVARLTGMSVISLVKAVFLTELRIQRRNAYKGGVPENASLTTTDDEDYDEL